MPNSKCKMLYEISTKLPDSLWKPRTSTPTDWMSAEKDLRGLPLASSRLERDPAALLSWRKPILSAPALPPPHHGLAKLLLNQRRVPLGSQQPWDNDQILLAHRHLANRLRQVRHSVNLLSHRRHLDSNHRSRRPPRLGNRPSQHPPLDMHLPLEPSQARLERRHLVSPLSLQIHNPEDLASPVNWARSRTPLPLVARQPKVPVRLGLWEMPTMHKPLRQSTLLRLQTPIRAMLHQIPLHLIIRTRTTPASQVRLDNNNNQHRIKVHSAKLQGRIPLLPLLQRRTNK